MNKFFNKITYKNKVLYFSSLLLSTSIVCPLTSCGSDNTSNDIGGFDKEFGFDAQTYDRLERQFISKYSTSLKDKFPDSNEFENKLNNFLQNDITILRNKLFDPAQNYSFTFRTNALLDYASTNFNIQLNRNANVSDIDFDNLRQSSLENFVICMENMGFTNADIDERKAEFNNKFDEILENCKSKTTDNAQILMQLRANVIDCWQDVNDELAYLSAYNHLKNFFNEYEFKVKDKSDKQSKLLWDDLLNNSIFMGGENNIGKIDQDINCSIDGHWINALFTISKISEKKEDEVTTYNKMENIPGFILTPVLKTMSQDIYSNEYYMNIDWQLMCAKYQGKDQKTIDKVTAHLATTKDGKAVDYTDFKDGQLPSDSFQFTRYSFMATPSYQKQKIFEAYFDQTKEPDQKIVFSWNKYMFGIEYFLPSDAKNKEDFIPSQASYKVPMARNNLSLIGLQLNGINLFDLLNKKINLQASQSVNNANIDDNLKIEEKFVKYCDISTIANVTFSDNDINKNTIQNSFTATFTNTNVQYDIETKSNMNNVQPSKSFSNNAVNFYKQVSNYVNSKRILDETETWHQLTILIQVELYILFGLIAITLIFMIVRYFFSFHNGQEILPPPDQEYKYSPISGFLLHLRVLVVLFIITLSFYLLWKFTVNDPISKEVDEVKKWNDRINGSKSDDSDDSKKINVIEKVNGEDKKNFKSVDDFMNYYEKNSNNAFKSYFYYFHFVELSQNQTNSKQLTTINEDVKKDYDDFNETKNGLNIGDRNFGRIVIGILSSAVFIFGLVFLSINITETYRTISDWRENVYNIDNHIAQVGGIILNPNDDPLRPQYIAPDNPN